MNIKKLFSRKAPAAEQGKGVGAGSPAAASFQPARSAAEACREAARMAGVDLENLPSHIAVIMDGNGRWATSRNLPRNAGHKAGSEAFRRFATCCSRLGVRYLTVYAFSTENWKRPQQEVDGIMELLRTYLHEAIEKMVAENVSLHVIGDESRLSDGIRSLLSETDALSEQTDGLRVNLAVNYGARAEIVRAAQALAQKAAEGTMRPEDITEETLSGAMYTAGMPDPELVIRPGAEKRLSNFLLWQSAYSELYFDDKLWPDYTDEDLFRAVVWYQSRHRRFGGVK